jgi:hypothetical protein
MVQPIVPDVDDYPFAGSSWDLFLGELIAGGQSITEIVADY